MGIKHLLSDFGSYTARGSLYSVGFMPTEHAGHNVTFSGYGQDLTNVMGTATKPGMKYASKEAEISVKGIKTAFSQAPRWSRAGSIAGSAVAPVLGAFFAYQSYQEEGMKGVYDYAWWEVGTAAAVAKHAYGLTTGVKGVGAITARNPLLRGLGAAVGASLGQAATSWLPGIGAPVGALVGGYVGAAPISMLAKHPFLAGGIALGGAAIMGAKMAGKAATELVKNGYAYDQRRRNINTDGDMSAFMTQNAMTMRARAVNEIQKSHMNARSALGQEANFMYMPNRFYGSRYRAV